MTRATRIAIVAIIGVIAVYDLIAIACAGVPASISAAMLTVGVAHPVLPFTWGGLTAHLFLPRRKPLAGLAWTIAEGAAAFAAVVACLVDLLRLTPATASPIAPVVALLVGGVAGHVFFAQPAPCCWCCGAPLGALHVLRCKCSPSNPPPTVKWCDVAPEKSP